MQLCFFSSIPAAGPYRRVVVGHEESEKRGLIRPLSVVVGGGGFIVDCATEGELIGLFIKVCNNPPDNLLDIESSQSHPP